MILHLEQVESRIPSLKMMLLVMLLLTDNDDDRSNMMIGSSFV
jgi:hypothetical protein